MSAPNDVDVWVRYFDRREAEDFGPQNVPLSVKRETVLGYVRANCPAAAEAISMRYFEEPIPERQAA